ncbi:alpha/beta hydrolase [Marivirga arenosa]|uniref:Alpha/beta hydrolase n=1 Tax=Marivirga arenosa TaxID=3059076 RepID=A0AA49GDM8_9BACT|nr:alpha/beta hydrolase [Marivirga sp. ABR2-2]WKK83819.2 alpha/beta hydrolase [Marivirga sp. ABR2-2]
MRYLVIVILISLNCLQLRAQGDVYWMHGFQGEEPGRWELYENRFQQERNLRSLTPDFGRRQADMNNGIANAAAVVENQVINNNNSVLIGHSMGGLVAREMDRRNNRNFGGIITVGTPNHGARVANSLRANTVIPALEIGLQELTRGPANTIIANAVSGFSTGLKATDLIDQLWVNFGRNLVINQLPDANSPTIEDLSAGSIFLNRLNNTAPRVPVLNIILEENDKQALRMAAAAQNAPEEQALHSFDDGAIISTVSTMTSVYKAMKIYHLGMRFTAPVLWGMHQRKANNWQAGETYLKSTFFSDYDEIIGAQRFEWRTLTRQVLQCSQPIGGGGSGGGTGGGTGGDGTGGGTGGGGPIPIDPGFHGLELMALPIPSEPCLIGANGDDCFNDENCQWVTETYRARVRISEGSDGLIPLSSQRMDNMPNINVYDANGVNHLEVGNHPRMTEILNQIFDRRNEVFFRE